MNRTHCQGDRDFYRPTRLALLLSLVLVFTFGAAAQMPTLVQHDASSNARVSTNVSPVSTHCYTANAAAPAQPGNAIVFGFTFAGTATPTVTDDQGDTYAISVNYAGGGTGQSIAIATAFNVAAGARAVKVCFSATTTYIQPVVTELANVTGVDAASVGNHGTGTAAACGSMTPTQAGDLAYCILFDTSIVGSNGRGLSRIGTVAPGGGMELLSADQLDGFAAEYGINTGTNAVNPGMTIGSSSDEWVAVGILLKAGNAGSVPSGERIVRVVHENLGYNTQAGGTGSGWPNPLSIQLPTDGNEIVVVDDGGGGAGEQYITGITDTQSNTYAAVNTSGGSPSPYSDGNNTVLGWYAGNSSASNNLLISATYNGNQTDRTVLLFDIVGGPTSPPYLDTQNGATGNSGTDGSFTYPYTITPASIGEFVFTMTPWNRNTASSVSSSPGNGYLLTDFQDGESIDGPAPVDENNCHGYAKTTATTPLTFTCGEYNSSENAGPFASIAFALIPGPSGAAPAPPTDLRVTSIN